MEDLALDVIAEAFERTPAREYIACYEKSILTMNNRAQFQRLRQRRGPKKAVCAVAASMLTAIWHMLHDGTVYQDLGANHFHKRSPEQQARHLAQQIAKLGFTCSIMPQPDMVSA